MNKQKQIRKKLTASVVTMVILAFGLCVTTFALVYSIVTVDNNRFQTGTVKINLNGGKPVIEDHEFLFEPGMTVEKIKEIVGERIDTLCRGGCLIPFGNSSTPFFRQAVEECVAERADFYPGQLSGGQQQRVAIARALALGPDILCFDEPTSALDPELTSEVLRVIRTLAEQKTTMIIVTHEMAFARDVADQVIFMDEGVIVEQGSAKEVIENPQQARTRQFLARYSQG